MDSKRIDIYFLFFFGFQSSTQTRASRISTYAGHGATDSDDLARWRDELRVSVDGSVAGLSSCSPTRARRRRDSYGIRTRKPQVAAVGLVEKHDDRSRADAATAGSRLRRRRRSAENKITAQRGAIAVNGAFFFQPANRTVYNNVVARWKHSVA